MVVGQDRTKEEWGGVVRGEGVLRVVLHQVLVGEEGAVVAAVFPLLREVEVHVEGVRLNAHLRGCGGCGMKSVVQRVRGLCGGVERRGGRCLGAEGAEGAEGVEAEAAEAAEGEAEGAEGARVRRVWRCSHPASARGTAQP